MKDLLKLSEFKTALGKESDATIRANYLLGNNINFNDGEISYSKNDSTYMIEKKILLQGKSGCVSNLKLTIIGLAERPIIKPDRAEE